MVHYVWIIAKNDASGTYRYEWTGTPVTLKLDIDSYQTLDVPVSTDHSVSTGQREHV